MNENEELEKKKLFFLEWRGQAGTKIFRNRVQAELLASVENLITPHSLTLPHTELVAKLAYCMALKEQLDYLDYSENILEEPMYDRDSWLSSPSEAGQ